jgi:hypothetical protein
VFKKPGINGENPTVYTNDYKRKIKTVQEEVTQENGEIKIVEKKRTREILRSLMCYYDKADEQGLVNVFWKRFELRFSSERYLKVASIEDLDLPLKQFAIKIQPYMIKRLNRRLGSRAFLFIRYKYLKEHYPYLYKVFKEAGFKAHTTLPFSGQKLCV